MEYFQTCLLSCDSFENILECFFRRFFFCAFENDLFVRNFDPIFFFVFCPSETSVHRTRSILGIVEPENLTELDTAGSPLINHGHKNCNAPAIHEIPPDGFTREQRQSGWIVVHVVLAIYCFWFLATICDEYFVPCIQSICSCFNLNEDVVGATFMAAAASSPELFINCVGTFITKSDLGVGAIVGSAVFNVLAVPACCGLFAGKVRTALLRFREETFRFQQSERTFHSTILIFQVIFLDWWPVSRDCLMYGVSVISLIITLQDGIVMWYEALLLVFFYVIYIAGMNDSHFFFPISNDESQNNH